MSQTFQTQPVKDNSDNVIKFLKLLEEDAKNGHEMAELGIHTKLAKNISDFFHDPLNGLVNSFDATHKGLVGFLDAVIVIPFLKSNKDIILNAYRAKKDYPLSYYIILKEDTTQNREKFFQFLDNYGFLDIDRYIPITFSFLPVEAAGLPELNEPIVLD
jgi:hypothetical protein